MAFTQAAKDHLKLTRKTVTHRIEMCTNFSESAEWAELAHTGFSLTRDANSPAVLKARLVDSDEFADDMSPANRVQLFANIRMICQVGGTGGESEVLFDGRVFRIERLEGELEVTAQDWLAVLGDCECEVDLAPVETGVIEPARGVALCAGGAFGSVFGFQYTGSGDPAFNQDANPGTRRRSWAMGNIQVWYDAGATEEVAPKHYKVNHTGGTVTILEDTSGNNYYVTGVCCYVEGTLDWAEVYRAALGYPLDLGGPGIPVGSMDVPDLGLDVAGPFYFQGRISDLLMKLRRTQQDNLRLWYESALGKFKLRLITQKQPGNEEGELINPKAVTKSDGIRDVYSRVVVTGYAERPLNFLADNPSSITDLTTQGDWFTWDGLNVGPDSTFSNIIGKLHDGDASRGAAVHNLPASENGGTDRYDSWYNFVKIDLGELSRIQRVRVVMPGSRNINAAAGHQGRFWPGIRILVSDDDAEYRLLSPFLCGRYGPHEQLDIGGDQLLTSKARYLKVQLGAYKHGTENEQDPCIGLSELEIYNREEYRVVREICGDESPLEYYQYTADYDGDGTDDLWRRNHPNLWSRLGGRHRTLFISKAGELNEFMAADHALDLLSESVRLFRQVTFRSICDPTIQLYDTQVVMEEFGGVSAMSILIERIIHRSDGTWITGSDYLAPGMA